MGESCIALNGSQGRQGGRPSVSFYDPNLPIAGKAVTKSSVTTTFIVGSTDAGEALPPRFQFSTKATESERERIWKETFKHFHYVRGKFGFLAEREFPATVGMKRKGGNGQERV